MDYVSFYRDISNWITIAERKSHEDPLCFFEWLYVSAGQLGNKYQNTEYVKKQICLILKEFEDLFKEVFRDTTDTH